MTFPREACQRKGKSSYLLARTLPKGKTVGFSEQKKEGEETRVPSRSGQK